MVARMHPRSSWTMSLFTSTLAFSFLIVGLPHMLPCPVPPRPLAEGESFEVYTDDNGRRRRRRVLKSNINDEELTNESEMGRNALEEAKRRARECPVPKPSGLVGQIMGFQPKEGAEDIKREVRVEPLQRWRKPISREENSS